LVKKEELESIPDRVWTSNDMQRILPSIDGKTAANAVQFIQDTEDVPKRIASKLLNEMEANQMFEWIKNGRSNTIQTNSTI
jgi:hypothetical protein